MDKERLIQIVTEEVQKELAGKGKVAPSSRPPQRGETLPSAAGTKRMLVNEEMMLKVAKEGCKELRVPKDAIITPFARDRALEFRIKIIKE